MRIQFAIAVLAGFAAALQTAWKHRAFRIATAVTGVILVSVIGFQSGGALVYSHSKGVESVARYDALDLLLETYDTRFEQDPSSQTLRQSCAGKIPEGSSFSRPWSSAFPTWPTPAKPSKSAADSLPWPHSAK